MLLLQIATPRECGKENEIVEVEMWVVPGEYVRDAFADVDVDVVLGTEVLQSLMGMTWDWEVANTWAERGENRRYVVELEDRYLNLPKMNRASRSGR